MFIFPRGVQLSVSTSDLFDDKIVIMQARIQIVLTMLSNKYIKNVLLAKR